MEMLNFMACGFPFANAGCESNGCAVQEGFEIGKCMKSAGNEP